MYMDLLIHAWILMCRNLYRDTLFEMACKWQFYGFIICIGTTGIAFVLLENLCAEFLKEGCHQQYICQMHLKMVSIYNIDFSNIDFRPKCFFWHLVDMKIRFTNFLSRSLANILISWIWSLLWLLFLINTHL